MQRSFRIMAPRRTPFVVVVLLACCSCGVSFAPTDTRLDKIQTHFANRKGVLILGDSWPRADKIRSQAFGSSRPPSPPAFSSQTLFMAQNGDGTDILKKAGAFVVFLLLLASAVLPNFMDAGGGGGGGMSIADSVVTVQDAPTKFQNFESKEYRLSRSSIQEKISQIPVFYLVDDQTGSMMEDIYLSYEDAMENKEGSTIKATSLDQVMYPLILRRGRMRMAEPPSEIQKAETEMSTNPESVAKKYKLVPSKKALAQASAIHMPLKDGDVPLFVADRLAFASPKGPQLPLFLDQDDCIATYRRLQQGTKSSLPDQPVLRSATLFTELDSMERGTRPGISQLAFYGTAQDLQKATDIYSQQSQ